MRQRISTNIRWVRFLHLGAGLIMLYYIVSSMENNSIDQEKMILGIVSILIFTILFYLFYRAKTVEFDKNFMYVTGKTGQEKIPLKNVIQIKVTMMKINRKHVWAIRYYNNIKAEKSVRILPGKLHQQFDEFKYCVTLANKDAKIENRPSSFDFDQ